MFYTKLTYTHIYSLAKISLVDKKNTYFNKLIDKKKCSLQFIKIYIYFVFYCTSPHFKKVKITSLEKKIIRH